MLEYIENIILLLIEGIEEQNMTEKQVACIQDYSIEYTDTGMFINIKLYERGKEFAIPNKDIFVLDGVLIESEALDENGAEGILHFKNGLINYLEIWAYSGNYPAMELKNYTLTQIWKGSKGLVYKKKE